jgi:hypothetical protein
MPPNNDGTATARDQIADGPDQAGPPTSISDGTSNTITDSAKPGLQTAEAHSGGVISWSPTN